MDDMIEPGQSERGLRRVHRRKARGGGAEKRPRWLPTVVKRGLLFAGGIGTILGLVTGGINLADRLRAAQTPTSTVPSVYRPFANGGDGVAKNIKVAQTATRGSCFGQSDYVDRPGVWRCSNDQGSLDPCFSSPNLVTPPGFVLCALDGPGKPVIELPLSEPLPDFSVDQRLDNQIIATTSLPWYLVMGNGAQCRRTTPVQNASGLSEVRYLCSDGSDGVGDVVRSDKLWTILVSARGSGTEKPMPIREAWF